MFSTRPRKPGALKIVWNRVKKDWKAGVKADLRVARSKRRESTLGGLLEQPLAWNRVAGTMQRYDAAKASWEMAKAALELFRLTANSMTELGPRPGFRKRCPPWRARRGRPAAPAQVPEAFTFLDQLHARLAKLPIEQQLREALVRLWWLRRSRSDDQAHKASRFWCKRSFVGNLHQTGTPGIGRLQVCYTQRFGPAAWWRASTASCECISRVIAPSTKSCWT